MKSLLLATLFVPALASAAETNLKCDINWDAYEQNKSESVEVKGENYTATLSKHAKATIQRAGGGYRVILNQWSPPMDKVAIVYDVSCDTNMACTGKREYKEDGTITMSDKLTFAKRDAGVVGNVGDREVSAYTQQGKGFTYSHVEYHDQAGKAYGLKIKCADANMKRDVAQEARTANVQTAARQTQAQVQASLDSAEGRASVARGQQLVQAGAPGKCVMCHTAGPNGFVPRDRNATTQINTLRAKLRESSFLGRVHTRLLTSKSMPMGGSPQLTDQGRIDIRNYLASFAQ